MAIHTDLIPFRVVKTLSKGLAKAFSGGGRDPSKLSDCHEALARAMGYDNWGDLARQYDTFAGMPDFMKQFSGLLQRTLDSGHDQLNMRVENRAGTRFFIHTRTGRDTLLHEDDEDMGLRVAMVVYNVLMDSENRDITFDPKRVSEGFMCISTGQVPLHVDISFLPADDGFTASFRMSVMRGGLFLPALFSRVDIERLHQVALSEGAVGLVAEDRRRRHEIVEGVATVLLNTAQVCVVSDRAFPRLPRKDNLMVVKVEAGKLGEVIDDLAHSGHDAVLVDHPDATWDLVNHRALASKSLVALAFSSMDGRDEVKGETPGRMIGYLTDGAAGLVFDDSGRANGKNGNERT